VHQVYVRLHLISGRRHAETSLTLGGVRDEDRSRLAAAFSDLRTVVAGLPEDPHLLYATEPTDSRDVRPGRTPEPEAAVEGVARAAGDSDLVGFYAAGPICRGFANSLGQRNWHEVRGFNFEWSLYQRADKAIKASYAGFEWSDDEFAAKMRAAREQFATLAREPRTLAPGAYRAYLAPAALAEIASMLCWGGFAGRARETRQSCLLRMQTGDAAMAPAVTFREATAEGIAPAFQADGFVRPPAVPLVTGGRLADALVAPRTAREFGIAHNGANAAESPEALELGAGELATADALAQLGRGLYIGNLWYLNFSDRPACRVTGMTRFGTFWVEDGEIVAPVNVMRFDDTLYRLLGDRLEALTRERDFMPDPLTYRERAVDSMRLPGALVSEITLTL
jgi:predicted Zn-dependent protease